jgi:hypothetical protein
LRTARSQLAVDRVSPATGRAPEPAGEVAQRPRNFSQPTPAALTGASKLSILEESPPTINSGQNNTTLIASLDLPKIQAPAPLPNNFDKLVPRTYNGIVVDAACGASTRVHAGEDKPRCVISTATAMFALRLEDGQIVRFDSVGNLRAQNAKKKHRWVAKSVAGKDVRAKVNGAIVGDQMIVVSID